MLTYAENCILLSFQLLSHETDEKKATTRRRKTVRVEMVKDNFLVIAETEVDRALLKQLATSFSHSHTEPTLKLERYGTDEVEFSVRDLSWPH